MAGFRSRGLWTGGSFRHLFLRDRADLLSYIRRMADRITERFPRDPHPGLSDPQRLFRGADHGDRASHRTGYPGAAFREGLGEILYLPENLLRSGEHVLLDDVTVEDIAGTLQVRTDIVKSSGYDFADAFVEKDNRNEVAMSEQTRKTDRCGGGKAECGKVHAVQCLAGERILIVKDTPGITRDRIYADVTGWTGCSP